MLKKGKEEQEEEMKKGTFQEWTEPSVGASRMLEGFSVRESIPCPQELRLE